jgi:two-component sensor histidine kinase
MGLKIANDFRQEQSKYSVKATVALIAALFILFVAVLVSAIYQARQEAQRSAESRADAASQVVATNTKWIVELARQALQRIDDTMGDNFHAVERQAVQNIADAVESLPGSVKAFVADARGNAIYSTDPSMTPVDVAGQEYFTAPAAGTAWYTSSLLVNGADGEQTFVFSKRLERGGKFAGVAAVSFNVTQFSEIWASLGLDKESTVSIIRDDGQLVARYPLADGPLDLSKYILFTEYLPNNPSGVYPAVSPVDGIARFVGYRKVTGTELVAIASVSTSAAYRLFWQNTAWILGLSVPTAIALAFASLWIVRLIQSGLRRQAELASALELNRLLFRDTHHRVKNNLQSVQSLVRMQNIPAEVKSDLQGRIAAMTAVHEHMYRLDQYADIDASELLPSIIAPLQKTYGDDHKFVIEIEPFVVDRDFATPLALLVNEVVTNALKYAFPGKKAGTIKVALHKRGGRAAELVIADDGVGFDPDVAIPGMGNRLIKAMVLQLEGSSSYVHGEGTVFTAEINVAPATAGIGFDAKRRAG